MVHSGAGREYRIQSLTDGQGNEERYSTCLECGALVGPMIKHRDAHDQWHERVDRH
jgi:hypothetical protein